MIRNMWIGLLFFVVVLSTTAFSATYLWVEKAEASGCAQGCYARHAQCRIQTKGSPSCDAALRQCLKGCLRRR